MATESMHALAATAIAALTAILGGFLLALCVARLGRLIVPKVRIRFDALQGPHEVDLPTAGRYVINILIPPLTFIIGTAHASAAFAIRDATTGDPIAYRSHGRALFQIKRSDMSGRTSVPLGSFVSPSPGRVQITCLNPEAVQRHQQLEVSPHIAVLPFILLILMTLASSAMLIGGTVLSILRVTGTI